MRAIWGMLRASGNCSAARAKCNTAKTNARESVMQRGLP